jgi:hypothetical protein
MVSLSNTCRGDCVAHHVFSSMYGSYSVRFLLAPSDAFSSESSQHSIFKNNLPNLQLDHNYLCRGFFNTSVPGLADA